MIGYLVAFILVGVGVYYAYYLKQKVRIDKKYAIKILEKSFPDDSFSEENVSIKRSGEIKHEDTEINEMVFFKVYATSDESKEYDLEIRRYNPQADIEAKEYEEFQKGAKAEDSVTDSVLSGSPDAANTATIESAQSMMQEQSKREEEDKLIRSRILQHELGIKIAKILSQKSRIIPEIYYYDKRKYCSLIEYPGSTLLKDYFEEIDEEAKESSIIKIINNIAKIHNSFSDISVYLPPRRD